MNAGFSAEVLLVGPLVGLLVARLFGRLTWPRALLASALGSAAFVLLVPSIDRGMLGMPRRVYTAEGAESAFRLSWQEYIVAGVGSALPGTSLVRSCSVSRAWECAYSAGCAGIPRAAGLT